MGSTVKYESLEFLCLVKSSSLLFVNSVKIITEQSVNSLPAALYRRFLPKLLMLLKAKQGKRLILLCYQCAMELFQGTCIAAG